jgi:hypothetical protein
VWWFLKLILQIYIYSFCHYRDYAATHGLLETMGTEVNVTQNEQGDLFYTLYFDNPMEHGGSYQRFVTGILLVDASRKSLEQTLLPKPTNKKGRKNQPTDDNQTPPSNIWSKSDLPSVDAGVLEFPCTFGFVSALMMSYRVSEIRHIFEQQPFKHFLLSVTYIQYISLLPSFWLFCHLLEITYLLLKSRPCSSYFLFIFAFI